MTFYDFPVFCMVVNPGIHDRWVISSLGYCLLLSSWKIEQGRSRRLKTRARPEKQIKMGRTTN